MITFDAFRYIMTLIFFTQPLILLGIPYRYPMDTLWKAYVSFIVPPLFFFDIWKGRQNPKPVSGTLIRPWFKPRSG